ncbi:MAG: hypothetical protein KGD63_12865 [Candidatus Lokiarchaeota archaeon]|nr:hypothetical protein [Candidatus Lokiarchaeota archaeon]
MKCKNIKIVFILCLSLIGIGLSFSKTLLFSNFSDKNVNIENSSIEYNDITIISDNSTNYFYGYSSYPASTIDNEGNIHVVWSDDTIGEWGGGTNLQEIMYAKYIEGSGWSNPKVISDGYNGVYWNVGWAMDPQIFVDINGSIHVVWYDAAPGPWGEGGSFTEIFYVNYTETFGWSNVTVVSDGYNGDYWNENLNYLPSISGDEDGNIYVLWTSEENLMFVNYTKTNGWSNVSIVNNNHASSKGSAMDNNGLLHIVWQTFELGSFSICYANYSEINGWSDYIVLSNEFNDDSRKPDIVIDINNTIHVVWHDETDGSWGSDDEIVYIFNNGTGWSNGTIISDDETNWNKGQSRNPDIAIGNNGNIYVSWEDLTNGTWGDDKEIMFSFLMNGLNWSKAMVISDDDTNWNNDDSFRSSINIDISNNIHIVWQDDTDGIWGVDSEIMYNKISIEDLSPDINHPEDIEYEEGMTGNIINWTATDLNPKNYTIKRNGNNIDNGTWISGNPISIDVSGLIVDIYNYTLNTSNLYGYWSSDTVYVTVHPIVDPILDLEDDFSYTEGESGNYINWIASDLFPNTFSISRNGSEIDSGTWTNMQLYFVNIDGLTPGIYEFIFNVSDKLENWDSDTIIITVEEKNKPSIPFGNFWVLYTLISIVGLIIYVKKKKL